MRNRGFTSLAIIATVTVLALAAVAILVLPTRASTADPASATAPPRTADGQPDLQGTWTNYDSTPFEVFDPSDKPGLYSGDPDGTARGTGPASFPNDVTGRKLVARKSLVVDLVQCPTLGAPSREPQANPLLDNYEGMAVVPGRRGVDTVELISDDNFSPAQFTRVLNLIVRLP